MIQEPISFEEWKIKNKIKETFKNRDKLYYQYNSYYIKLKSKGIKSHIHYFSNNDIYSKKHKKFIYSNLYEFSKANKEYQLKSLIPLKESFYKKLVLMYENNLYLKNDFIKYKELNILGNESLIYGELNSLHYYLLTLSEKYFLKKINKEIPNMLWQPYGTNLFCKQSDNTTQISELNIRAIGREEEYKNLNTLYQEELFFELSQYISELIKPYSGYIFRLKKGTKYNQSTFDIIGGEEAARKITFDDYLNTLIELEQPYSFVKQLMDKKIKPIIKSFVKLNS